MNEDAEQGRALEISTRVFVYGLLCTLLVSIVVSVTATAWSLLASSELDQVRLARGLAQDGLGSCLITLAETRGRVRAFESVLITPQHTAVGATIREFLRATGKPATEVAVEELLEWFDRAK